MLESLKRIIGAIPGARPLAEGIWYNLGLLRRQGLKKFLQRHWLLANALIRLHLRRKRYRLLTVKELLATRKSDKVFIFGSGYSLNDIALQQWAHFAGYDTLGLSGFIYQKWVRTDYHLVRGWVETSDGFSGWKKFTPEFANTLEGNPFFRDTILVMQGDYSAQFCNQLLGYGYIGAGRRVFRYKTVRYDGPPTVSLDQGLRHAVSTLCDAVNFAFCMGWKEIVLVGVDLYDSRYFWLPPDKTLTFDLSVGTPVPSSTTVRGIRFDQAHSTAKNNLIKLMAEWQALMKTAGCELIVYNPRSLLARVLPLYTRDISSLILQSEG